MFSSMGPEHLKSALPPRWQPSRDCMTWFFGCCCFFFLFSVLVEVNRDNSQLCETLVLACLFFFWWPMTFFYVRSGQLLAKVARGPFSGHSHAHSLPTHSSHLLSLCCDLRPQLWEESAWSIFNIETKVQSQAISGSDPDPNYLKNSLGDTQLPWGMRTIAQENL